jgi:hypothetical protein
VEVKFHTVPVPENGGDWPASFSCRFTPFERLLKSV